MGFDVHHFDLLFINPDFVKKYIDYLEKFTQPSFFKDEITQLNPLLSIYEDEIKKEYGFYHFDIQKYENRAAKIRNSLKSFKKGIAKKLKKKPKVKFYRTSKKADYLPINKVSILPNIADSSGFLNLQLRNYYYNPLLIIALMTGNDTTWLKTPVKTPPFILDKAPKITTIPLSAIPNNILYKTMTGDSIFRQKVIGYRAPIK